MNMSTVGDYADTEATVLGKKSRQPSIINGERRSRSQKGRKAKKRSLGR